jgi:hypothetical protein
MARDADRDVQELYALPPEEFTRARNARAEALKAAGHPDAAEAVRQLRRPTPPLWAVNRLAHLESKQLEAFLTAVDEVRRTQLRDPRAAADALRQQRADLDALVGRAGQLLAGPGGRPTPEMERRIADTLMGAAVDPPLAQALRGGRLTTELSAPGFEVLTGAPAGGHLRLVGGRKSGHVTETPERARRAAEAEKKAAVRERREADRDAVLRERRAQREAAAHQERERRRRAAEEAEREAEARRAAAETAQRELEELTRQVSAARERLREAQRAARAAASAGRKARRADGRPS